MQTELLFPGEVLCDLQRNGLRILQKERGFRFGTDAVLLADFCAALPGEHICDMGTGTGVLPLLIAARAERTSFDAFEIQPQMADMAARSVLLNGLDGRIRVHALDLRFATQQIGYEHCDMVVTNPPYTKEGSGLESPDAQTARSRTESCSLEEWMEACARVLRFGGRLCTVFPAPRMLELCDAMRSSRVEPKRVRFVSSGVSKPPKLVLLEGRKGGRAGLHILPLLVTHDETGGFTDEMNRIYGEMER